MKMLYIERVKMKINMKRSFKVVGRVVVIPCQINMGSRDERNNVVLYETRGATALL